MIVFIQLTTAGADTGPFDLYSDSDGYLSPFITTVPLSTLLAGNNFGGVPDDALFIKIVSIGVCTNDIIVPIGTTTSTTTSTSTSTSTSTTTSSSTTSSTSSTSSSTTTSTTTFIPDDVIMRLNALTIDPVITDKLHFDFDILNGTGSNFNTITQVMNVTNATSWIILNSSSSFAHSVVNHTGLSSSLFSPNVSGQTFAMRFSTNNGSSWTGTMYFTSPLILDYPI